MAKNKSASRLAEFEQQYTVAHNNANQMREMHDKLVSNIEELNSRKDMIKSKLAVAKAQEHINHIAGSSVDSANNSIAAFERFEEKANKALDKANAEAELNKGNESIKDLESKYASGSVDVNNELADLKASLNK